MNPGRISVQQRSATGTTLSPGLHRIPLRTGRETLLYIPEMLASPVPLVVSFHGAGGNAGHGMGLFRSTAAAGKFAVLAPSSSYSTWDVIKGGYGPDIQTITEALQYSFDHLPIADSRLAAAGFSDGASYALSVGIMNGDVFPNILAYSPGFMAPTNFSGKPRIFISHGIRDRVLPIDKCSRQLVPRLRRLEYPLEYREFDGAHEIPELIRTASVGWWLRQEQKTIR